jgi:hypothetical protein
MEIENSQQQDIVPLQQEEPTGETLSQPRLADQSTASLPQVQPSGVSDEEALQYLSESANALQQETGDNEATSTEPQAETDQQQEQEQVEEQPVEQQQAQEQESVQVEILGEQMDLLRRKVEAVDW